LPQTITFSEQPLDTLNPVYLCKINTVSFTGVIVNDGSQPNAPALAHDASLIGSVGITFSNAVDFVQLDVGSFASVGCTTLSFYDASGTLITSMDNTQTGVQHFSFTPTGDVKIGSVLIADAAGSESAPFSVDSLTFSNTPPLVDKTTVAPVGALSPADINGVLWGYKWDHTNFTYSFPTSTAEYLTNGYQEITDFLALDTQQQDVVRTILGMYAAVTNVTFTEVTTPAADFRFGFAGQYNTSDGNGLHVPGNGAGTAEANPVDPADATTAWGDSWFSNIAVNPDGNDNTDPVLGNFTFTAAFMHEIGHNLGGLKHGHVVQEGHGVEFPKLPFDHDSQEYSVMTYNSYPGHQTEMSQFPETPMLDDIAALQYLYGANYSTNNTDTVYSFDPDTGEMFVNGAGQGVPADNHILLTIWDGGGDDSYDFSNYDTAVTVNLGAGQWINLGTQLANLDSANTDHFARGNIANAYEFQGNPASLIEKATTGNGNDSVTGNDLDNALATGAGNDTLDGGAGADALAGGAGNDTYSVDNPGDAVIENADNGNDTVNASIDYGLTPNVENLVLQGAAIQGYGNDLANTITGNSGSNLINGGAGADTMAGGAGNDAYFVDNSGDQVLESPGEGNDTVYASIDYRLTANVDYLVLQAGAVQGYGNDLTNVISGTAGDNLLDGGTGADTMYGGDGNDAYFVDNINDLVIESANQGSDTVYASLDYRLSANVEYLVLQGSAVQGYGNDLTNVISGTAADNLLDGGTGADTMYGGDGNDVYFVDNAGDFAVENANQGNDTVYASVDYLMAANVDNLVLQGAAVQGYGNGLVNALIGNANDNLLNGGAAADSLTGGAGNDAFVFAAGEADGDTIADFDGNGADAGDWLLFVGYGSGATFTANDATHWQVTYNGGISHDIIAFLSAVAIDPTDYAFM
jgi:serralysin